MTFAVKFSEDARSDLRKIFDYVLENDGLDRAEALVEALYASCMILSEFPGRGGAFKEIYTATGLEYRELHNKPYRIIYEIVDESVIIHAVLDGRRDVETLLRERLQR